MKSFGFTRRLACDQSGSVLIPVLICFAILVVVGTSGIATYQSMLDAGRRERLGIERTNLEISLKFATTDPANCAVNFLSQASVAIKAQIANAGAPPVSSNQSPSQSQTSQPQNQSLQGVPMLTAGISSLGGNSSSSSSFATSSNSQSQDPSQFQLVIGSAGNSGIQLGSGKTYEELKIQSVAISAVAPLDTNQSYLAQLTIRFLPSANSTITPPPLVEPVYVSTGASGNPTGCHMTAYARPSVTLEDQICQTIKDANSQYDPTEQKCFN